MDRRHVPGAQGRIDRNRRVRPGDRVLLPDPGGAIRELDDALHGSARGADRLVRRAACHLGARHADGRLFADRVRDADRACSQERDPDRRIRQAPARERPQHRRGRDGSRTAAAAPDPDDGLRLHSRRGAADAGDRRRRGKPPVTRNGGVRRHAGRHRADPHFRAGVLRRHRAMARTSPAAVDAEGARARGTRIQWRRAAGGIKQELKTWGLQIWGLRRSAGLGRSASAQRWSSSRLPQAPTFRCAIKAPWSEARAQPRPAMPARPCPCR